MDKVKQQCPEFPFFGASYPDARCIDGYLWDLDKCNENGWLYGEGDIPCPFCQPEAFIEYDPFAKEDEFLCEILINKNPDNMTKAQVDKANNKCREWYLEWIKQIKLKHEQ